MLKTIVAAAAALFVLAVPVFADCEEDIVKIYESLETIDVADDDMARVNDLLDEAEAAQESGNEDGCNAAMAQAKALLKL